MTISADGSVTQRPDISIQTPQASLTKCPFFKLLQKIWNAVKSFFHSIKEYLFPPEFNRLQAGDIEYLQNAKYRLGISEQTPPALSSDLNRRNISVQTVNSTNPNAETAFVEEENDQEILLENPVYKQFYTNGLRLIENATEIAYTEFILPKVLIMQKHIGDLQDYLFKGADLAVSLGSRLSNPLDDKLSSFASKDIINDDMRQLLEWLSKEPRSFNIENVADSVKMRLENIGESEYLQWAVETCHEWIFHSDHQNPLLTDDVNFEQQNVLDLVFKKYIIILSENKIREFNDKVQDKLNNNLQTILQTMLCDNGRKIGHIVLGRLIKVIDKAPFSEMMNEIIQLLVNHSAGVIEAEKSRIANIKKSEDLIRSTKNAYEAEIQQNPSQEEIRLGLAEEYKKFLDDAKKLWIEIHSEEAREIAIEDAKVRLSAYNENPNDDLGIDLDLIRRLGGAEEWLRVTGANAKLSNAELIKEEIDRVFASDDVDAREYWEEQLFTTWLKQIGDTFSHDAYKNFSVSEFPLCHPDIDELDLVEPLTAFGSHLQGSEDGSSELNLSVILDKLVEIVPIILNLTPASQEKSLFYDSADRLIHLLLPDVDVLLNEDSQQVHKVDGIVYLFNKLEYPQEIKDLYEEAKYIYREVLTDERQKAVFEFAENNYRVIETCFLRYAKHFIKKTLSSGISSLFQKLIVPEKIDYLMAHKVLPSIQLSIAQRLVSDFFYQKYQSYSSTFAEIVQTEAESDELKEQLIQELAGEVGSVLNSSNSWFDGDGICLLVSQHISKLARIISDLLHQQENLADEDIPAFIKEAVDVYHHTLGHDSNPLYGDLAVNLIFKMGNLSTLAETYSGSFKGKLASIITDLTYDIQKSPHYLLSKVTELINEFSSDKDQLRDLVLGEPVEIDKESTETRLRDVLTKTAQIAHDFFLYAANQEAWYKRGPIKWVIGSDYSNLDRVIKRVYEQFFANPVYTQNLIVRMQEIISKALNEGAERVDIADASKPVSMDSIPTLASSFFER